MIETIIRYIIIAIVLGIIGEVISQLSNKKSKTIDENVSTKVIKLIQSYTGIVNKMVWRKY